MEGKKLLHSIRLKNLLSYGSEGVELELEPLNVLIGPNASGKSNLIDAISLLATAPRDLLKPLRQGGGVTEWIWKGVDGFPAAAVEASVEYKDRLIRYGLMFTAVSSRFELVDEFARLERRKHKEDARAPLERSSLYSYEEGRPKIRTRTPGKKGSPGIITMTSLQEVSLENSILAQVRGADVYPELTHLANRFDAIAFFRNPNLGKSAAPRLPQKVDLPQDFLLEDASNLGLILNDLQHRPPLHQQLLKKLRLCYEDIEYLTTRVLGGTIQIYFHERGLKEPVPASRLSDGALHFLCLLAILLHPEPPPLICLEEPELGLHPDVIPKVADLLLDAANRTQLIVTTHSETLVSRLSEVPECIVVCERDSGGTHLRRLDPDKLKVWLDDYSLGDLWAKGEIGGNRW